MKQKDYKRFKTPLLRDIGYGYNGLHSKCISVRTCMAKSVQTFLANYVWYIVSAMMQEPIENSVSSLWQCSIDSVVSRTSLKRKNK